MPARRPGPARPTSIRARSASRSPIPATNSAIGVSRRRRSAAIIELCRDILSRHPIPPQRVLAHSDVAPLRKEDPGELFPWGELHAAGIGHWVMPELVVAGPMLEAGRQRARRSPTSSRNSAPMATALAPTPDFDDGDGGGGARLPAPFPPGAGRRHRRRVDRRHAGQADRRASVSAAIRFVRWSAACRAIAVSPSSADLRPSEGPSRQTISAGPDRCKWPQGRCRRSSGRRRRRVG